MRFILTTCLSVIIFIAANSQSIPGNLPRHIYVENDEPSSHVQGIAFDIKNGYAYMSFTTSLIKYDLNKQEIVGSVKGLTCHLGCMDLDTESGKLYTSVEYKDDAIGKGIYKIMGKELGKRENTFYIGIFDTKKIDRCGIDAETGGVMTTVYLPEVVRFYEDTIIYRGKRIAHRYGCSGIDGISLGHQFGKTEGKQVLNVDVAIYGDKERDDNDYQILLQFDPKKIDKYAIPLDQEAPHHSGPKKADKRFYIYTGNTAYGIQNLEYDPYTHYWFAAVYKGSKPQYPNYSLFAIDGTQKGIKQVLKGFEPKEKGTVIPLAKAGNFHATSGTYGWTFDASTGIESLGGGYFYISKGGKNKEGKQFCDIKMYRYTGNNDKPFEEVK